MAGGHAGATIGDEQETGYKGIVSQPRIFGLACFASIGGLLFGYDQGVISGVLVMSSLVSLGPSRVTSTTSDKLPNEA